MKRFYLIAPLLLLGAFGYIFWQDHAASKIREDAAIAQAKQQAQETADKKAADERAAREASERRAAEREAEEKKREDDRRAKWEADSALIAAETARYKLQVEKSTQEIAELEKKLTDLRAENKRRASESFEAALETERLQIKRRTTELEAQRIVHVIAQRAIASQAIVPPVPSLPPPAAKK
jgi:hypothetical protein